MVCTDTVASSTSVDSGRVTSQAGHVMTTVPRPPANGQSAINSKLVNKQVNIICKRAQ